MLFEYLDTIIAFAAIMLILSLLITTVVQLVVAVFGLRGRNLLWGVGQLLKQVDPDLESDAEELARKVLCQPVLATSTNRVLQFVDWLVTRGDKTKKPWFNNGKRPPTAVRPKEILLILDRLRSDETLKEEVRKKLDALFDTLVAAPSAAGLPTREQIAVTLKEKLGEQAGAVAAEALGQLWKELSAEELAAKLKERLGGRAEELVVETLGKVRKIEAGISDWFDVVMDATSEKFKLWARWITAAGALVLAFGFQVDSLEIFNRLSSDPELRAAVLEQVVDVQEVYDAAYAESAPQTEDPKERFEQAGKAVDSVLEQVYKTPLLTLEPVDSRAELGQNLGGKLMTVLLLSLGAPFWYRALRNVVGFRSIVARKQETGGAASA